MINEAFDPTECVESLMRSSVERHLTIAYQAAAIGDWEVVDLAVETAQEFIKVIRGRQ